jgi:formylglycine-generating enzyme required for sulfatase activity/predicted Ser/Thr protein kinase
MQDNYSENDPLIGKILGEKFKINKRLGAGGMATVYKATQINLGREVALKIIHPNLVNDNESISRFYREARDLATLSHPSIVTVYDFGTEEGYHYISMEYLQGKNLTEVIRQEGRLDELKIVKYIAPIADALNHLHENGLIHRDIKSSNIFISSNDRAVLMDFGIAFHQDKTISMSGAILGTVEYMSPEQAKGEVIDGRSDIFSLGLVMYEAMTGRVPFYSDNPTSTLYKVVHEPPPAIPEDIKVSKELKSLVLSTLEKDVDQRPQNATVIYDILNSIVTLSEINRRKSQDEGKQVFEKGTSTSSGSSAEKQKKKSKTKPAESEGSVGEKKKSKLGIFLALGVVLLLAASGYYYFAIYSNKPAVDTSQLILLAKQAFGANDFVTAHKYYFKVATSDPKNVESKQMLTECILKLWSTYITPTLVTIPAGTFAMGNDAGGDDEKPQHNVTLSSFQLGKTEITNKQFVVFLNAMDCSSTGSINNTTVINLSKNKSIVFENGVFKVGADAENLPVTGISWNGADLFCKTFFGRLPTEAEWEYAACAGTNYIFSGSNDLNEIAWYTDNSSGKLNNVGTKKPNAFGIYDLTGNAWEWCNDFFDPGYYKRSLPQNPAGPETGDTKVIRGGDFTTPKEYLTNKFRSDENVSGSSGDNIGFRIWIPVK